MALPLHRGGSPDLASGSDGSGGELASGALQGEGRSAEQPTQADGVEEGAKGAQKRLDAQEAQLVELQATVPAAEAAAAVSPSGASAIEEDPVEAASRARAQAEAAVQAARTEAEAAIAAAKAEAETAGEAMLAKAAEAAEAWKAAETANAALAAAKAEAEAACAVTSAAESRPPLRGEGGGCTAKRRR